MKRTLLALFAPLFVLRIAAYGQSIRPPLSTEQLTKSENLLNQPRKQKTGKAGRAADEELGLERRNDQLVAAQLIELLKVLESEVITYSSLAEFQDSGKLARVPFAVFKRDLQKVWSDAAVLLSQLPQTRLKNEISNALLSYQDGGFWWEKVDAPRVVNVSNFSPEKTRTPADPNYAATIPYTIVIHWRHGSRYIKRAEKTLEQYTKLTCVSFEWPENNRRRGYQALGRD